MGKFKVGDRVRFAEGYGLASKGDEAVITGYSDMGNVCLDVRGHPHTCYERRVELANNSPVRTVTRREIVPGVYGDIRVLDVFSASVNLRFAEGNCNYGPSDLRAAARVFNEIADVLDEQKEAA